MGQRYRTERDGNIDPGYWNPEIGGRQGQRDMGQRDRGQRDMSRRDEGEGWESPAQGRARRDQGLHWSDHERGQDRVQGQRPMHSHSEDYRQTYDENADGRRQAGYGGARRHTRDDEGNYLGQGWDQASGGKDFGWDQDSDLYDRGGARQTTGRDYFGGDQRGDVRRDYGGYAEPGYASRGGQGRRTSPYSGSSAGYATGEAFGDESYSGAFVGGATGNYGDRDYGDREYGYRGDGGGRGWQADDLQRGSMRRGPTHRGKGPKGYARSAERIREEVCERLSDDDLVDASEISVTCREGGVLQLEGMVDSMSAKHRAEMIADQCAGVHDVDSRLKVARPGQHIGGLSQSGMQSGSHQPAGPQSAGPSTVQQSGGQQAGGQQSGGQGAKAAAREAEQDRQKH